MQNTGPAGAPFILHFAFCIIHFAFSWLSGDALHRRLFYDYASNRGLVLRTKKEPAPGP